MRWLAFVSFVAMVAGCGSPRSNNEAENLTSDSTPTAVASLRSDSLRLELRAPAEVRQREPVRVTLLLRNESAKPIELHLLGRTIAWDLVVSDTTGRVVWRRLEGAAVPAILRLEPLAPGQELTFTGEWDQRTSSGQPVEPGEYSLHATLPTDAPEPLRTPTVKLRIVRQ